MFPLKMGIELLLHLGGGGGGHIVHLITGTIKLFQ